MANLRDIKKRISSVTTTKQITRTMEMVSTAKIRRALDRSKQAEPYKEALTDVMLTVTYFRDRANVVMHFEGNSSEPDFNQARMISSHICDAYRAGELDRVELVYHHAKNRVDQELRVEHLLPLDPEMIAMAHGPRKNETDAPKRISSTFEFVPSPEHVLGKLVPSYILTVIYQALIDSAAAEQGARRKAMHSATENATAIISTLTRTYSRVRQASITTEINEIVGGASALEEQ